MEIVQGIISFNGFQVDRMQYERNINNEHSNNYSEITPKFFIKLVEKRRTILSLILFLALELMVTRKIPYLLKLR